ncbi:MAG: AAA family ATPase [Candidatus Natronoplasma sp.]
MKENPFEYRLLAKGEEFIDREKEIETIQNAAKSAQNLTIYSPRRYGKSSLILESFRRMDQDQITVYIDFNKINSVSELADELVSRTTESSYSSVEKGFSFVKDTLLSLRPTFTPTEEGGVSISMKLVEKEEDLESALEFPQKVAEKKNTEMVIAMDEFQRIQTLNGDTLERLFRSIIQEQDRVTYIFSGSQVGMLKEMFESGDKPFFKSTKMMELDKIPKEDFKTYIEKTFKNTDMDVNKTLINDILDLTDGHPMRTKELLFELWNRKRSDGSIEDVDSILDVLIENDVYIEEIWNGITSAVQRRTMEALANSKKPYSHETIEEYQLKGSSHVQRAIKSLERKGIVYQGEIVDPFLEEWIKRSSGQKR